MKGGTHGEVGGCFAFIIAGLPSVLIYPSTADSQVPPSRVYISNVPSGDPYHVIVIDPTMNTEIGAIKVGDTPGELVQTPDGSIVYAVVGNDLTVIDGMTNTMVTTVVGVVGILLIKGLVLSQ